MDAIREFECPGGADLGEFGNEPVGERAGLQDVPLEGQGYPALAKGHVTRLAPTHFDAYQES